MQNNAFEVNITFLDMKENRKKKIKIGYVPQSINVERHMPTTVYDMFASYICSTPVCFRKNKKVYDEIRNHLKLFGAEKLIEKGIVRKDDIYDVLDSRKGSNGLCATGICWNQVVCKGMAGKQRLCLKIKKLSETQRSK